METSIVTHSLKELRMPGMAECWKSMEETHQLDKLSVRDGMQLLIQAEISSRETNRVARLIRKASFRINASMEELDIDAARGVPMELVTQLSTGKSKQSKEKIMVNYTV